MQDDVVSRRQLLEAGVTRDTIRWHTGRSWRLVLPGVVLLSPALPTQRQRLVAAQLYAGEGVIAGSTAAALHGLQACSVTPPISVLVPHLVRARHHAWVVVRRTSIDDPGVVTQGPLRLSSRPRAFVDAAVNTKDSRQARAIIIEAVQRHLVRVDDLENVLDQMNRRFTAVTRRALAEATRGSWSVPEADLRALLSSSSVLPETWANPSLRARTGMALTTPDLWLDDVGIAIMVHSRRFHAGLEDWERTVECDGDLVAAGVRVVAVTPSHLARDPIAVLQRIEQTWQNARLCGVRPQVVATPRVVVPFLRSPGGY